MSRTSRVVHLQNHVPPETLKFFQESIIPDRWTKGTTSSDDDRKSGQLLNYSKGCVHDRQYISDNLHGKDLRTKIYNEMFNILEPINHAHWNFALEGFSTVDNPHYILYKGEDNAKFDWHQDDFDMSSEALKAANYNPNNARKLTIMICLNSASDYTGGSFQIDAEYNGDIFPDRGDVVVWPGYVKHRCTVVESGERLILVGFCHGPTFV